MIYDGKTPAYPVFLRSRLGTIGRIIHTAQIDEHFKAQIRVIPQSFHHLQQIACTDRYGEFTQLLTGMLTSLSANTF